MAAGPRLYREHPMTHAQAIAVDNEDRMNGEERRFAKRLEEMRLAGEIRRWDFEPIKFRVSGIQNWYTPDFIVVNLDWTMSCYDVKGRSWKGQKGNDRQLVKIKGVATVWPHFRWFLVAPKLVREGGGWKVTEFSDRQERETVDLF